MADHPAAAPGQRAAPPSVLVVLTTGRTSYRQAASSLRLNIERWKPDAARIDLMVSFDAASCRPSRHRIRS
ncbi:MAG TPA: hypothetical protein VMV07_01235 [Streptosporangiaceae bacterium]|nr:hypothetical protein [Streptosporangiaceae bacterium]